ncbi:hypothetical protein FK178_05825 [Antarcticibacterium arcticum]|uniref:Uncharacterized protein n=1 Tax=Antarcticibacterium arcticum TaxID=2585771 RepID=A0A5B8YNA3_9FLAO|nr:hypothetical protein [Antarcticibacterium arcticum]QED37259.1 hypothetical protein FK178_05825 [Antarcticibacterium arcticum]
MKNKMLPNHHKSGFSLPENYFRDFEARLMEELNEPQVSGNAYKGDPGFKVPENYFEGFEGKVLEKLNEERTVTKVIPLYRRKKFYYAAAVAAVFTGLFSTLLFNPPGNDINIDSLELSAIENYLDDEYLNFDKKEISVFMTDYSYTLDNFSTSRLSDEAVLEYISENVEDPNLLFE